MYDVLMVLISVGVGATWGTWKCWRQSESLIAHARIEGRDAEQERLRLVLVEARDENDSPPGGSGECFVWAVLDDLITDIDVLAAQREGLKNG